MNELQEDQRCCALCNKSHGKDEMYRVEIDEPSAFDWVCEDCYTRGQNE